MALSHGKSTSFILNKTPPHTGEERYPISSLGVVIRLIRHSVSINIHGPSLKSTTQWHVDSAQCSRRDSWVWKHVSQRPSAPSAGLAPAVKTFCFSSRLRSLQPIHIWAEHVTRTSQFYQSKHIVIIFSIYILLILSLNLSKYRMSHYTLKEELFRFQWSKVSDLMSLETIGSISSLNLFVLCFSCLHY